MIKDLKMIKKSQISSVDENVSNIDEKTIRMYEKLNKEMKTSGNKQMEVLRVEDLVKKSPCLCHTSYSSLADP